MTFQNLPTRPVRGGVVVGLKERKKKKGGKSDTHAYYVEREDPPSSRGVMMITHTHIVSHFPQNRQTHVHTS